MTTMAVGVGEVEVVEVIVQGRKLSNLAGINFEMKILL